jgi:hypothetical protein
MDYNRTLPRARVLAVFRSQGAIVKEIEDDEGRVLTVFGRRSEREQHRLPEDIPIRLVLRLAEKFDVPVEYFLLPAELSEYLSGGRTGPVQ